MAQPYPTKDFVNTFYHSALTTSLAVVYAVIGRKLMKLDVGDPGRPNLSDVITAGELTKEGLIKYKIIPPDILNK